MSNNENIELTKQETAEGVKILKRPKNLGRLNRLVASATTIVTYNGHDKKRFKRDYSLGVAHYQCLTCKAVAAVGVSEERGKVHMVGDAFDYHCQKVSS